MEYIDKCVVQGIGSFLCVLFSTQLKGSISTPYVVWICRYEEIQDVFSLQSCRCCFLWHWVKKKKGKRKKRRYLIHVWHHLGKWFIKPLITMLCCLLVTYSVLVELSCFLWRTSYIWIPIKITFSVTGQFWFFLSIVLQAVVFQWNQQQQRSGFM